MSVIGSCSITPGNKLGHSPPTIFPIRGWLIASGSINTIKDTAAPSSVSYSSVFLKRLYYSFMYVFPMSKNRLLL